MSSVRRSRRSSAGCRQKAISATARTASRSWQRRPPARAIPPGLMPSPAPSLIRWDEAADPSFRHASGHGTLYWPPLPGRRMTGHSASGSRPSRRAGFGSQKELFVRVKDETFTKAGSIPWRTALPTRSCPHPSTARTRSGSCSRARTGSSSRRTRQQRHQCEEDRKARRDGYRRAQGT